MAYHGLVGGPDGQIYPCVRNHWSETAAIRCANSFATRRMAAAAWNRAAMLAAQGAEPTARRGMERAAAEPRWVAAQVAIGSRPMRRCPLLELAYERADSRRPRRPGLHRTVAPRGRPSYAEFPHDLSLGRDAPLEPKLPLLDPSAHDVSNLQIARHRVSASW